MEPEDNLKDSPEDEPESAQAALAVQPREAWEKQFDESLKAYHAFSLFRDSEKRSLKLVADSLNCSVQNIFWWSTRHNWKLRVDAYDLHVDQAQRAEFIRGRIKMRDRHLQVARAMLGVAAHALAEWQGRVEAKLPLQLAPEQISLLVKCASELEKNTLGVKAEDRVTAINILVGSHKYDDEVGENGKEKFVPMAEIERREYERLSEDERRTWESWKDAPKLLTDDGDKTKPPN
jgi:hypothetical protein